MNYTQEEAIQNLIEATEDLMTWQVKNVKVWHNSAYDTAAIRLEQLRAALAQPAKPVELSDKEIYDIWNSELSRTVAQSYLPVASFARKVIAAAAKERT